MDCLTTMSKTTEAMLNKQADRADDRLVDLVYVVINYKGIPSVYLTKDKLFFKEKVNSHDAMAINSLQPDRFTTISDGRTIYLVGVFEELP